MEGGRYLSEIARRPVLSLAEERELAERFQHGDSAAVGRLVEANLRFVVKLAHRYRGSFDICELVQAGALGLLEAARRFDPRRGCRLITYAQFWIRAAMRETTMCWQRLPTTVLTEADEPIDTDPLADEYLQRKQLCRQVDRCVQRARQLLDERELTIMDQRLLADEPVTLRELASQMHVSSERVRQIEGDLLSWLRLFLEECGLAAANGSVQ